MTILSGIALLISLVSTFSPTSFIKIKSVFLIKNSSSLSNQKKENDNLSIRLKIPSINIDATIKSLSLTPDGAMDVPKGPNDVARFNLGTYPGEIGSSVIAGHFGWKNKIPAVFDNLDKLNIGDKIYIENDKGINIIFIVKKILVYSKDDNPSDVFNSSDGKSHLNLITCIGDWSIEEKTYSERLVIFADKE